MGTCFVCGAAFAPTTSHTSRCAPCRKDYDREWRAKRRAEGKPASGRQMPLEYHRAYGATYYQKPEVKERLRERARKNHNDPAKRHKHEARWKVNRAVASGRLVKMPCVVCGSPRSQGHHPDYSRPLDVVWLCAKHHAEEHCKIKEG